MAPTIVLRGGRPWLGLGSPGGSTIITTVLGLLVERIDFGSSLPAAIAVPRASQRDTPATVAEPAFLKSPEAAALAARGHAFTLMGEIGAATGVELLGRGRDGRRGRAGAARRRQRARRWRDAGAELGRVRRWRRAPTALAPVAVATSPRLARSNSCGRN